MIDGIITPAIRDIDYLTPSAPYPANPSGVIYGQQAIYRYSVPTEIQPTLIIKDFIPDYNGNFIKPGHYELALSNDKEFLYIIESRNLIATIPVFKLEENEYELKKYRDKNKELTKSERKRVKKEENKKKRKDKFQEIIDTKYAKTGATKPQTEYIYSNATIDYIKDGSYYLIKYEKGFIRAWGAIKIKN